MAPTPTVVSQLPGGRLTTLDDFHCGKGSHLFLPQQTLTWDVLFPSLHTLLLPKPPCVDLHSCLIHPNPIPQSITCYQRTPQERSEAMGPRSQNSLARPCSPPSGSSWLDRKVEWSSADSVTGPARWQYLLRLGHASPYTAPHHRPLYGAGFSPQVGFMGPGTKGWKWE